jgi:hypothetical protein
MSIFNYFKHLTLTSDQDNALWMLETFVNSDENLFMLKGYAGSGKTTVLKGVVEYLGSINQRYVLMAPTGRAAKVLSEKTGKKASTVHKGIYSYSLMEDLESEEGDAGSSFMYYYKLANNTTNDIIFIVDEASMISDNKSMGEFFRFGSGFLLTDLINFTHLGELNSRNKIIFVGDPCQLEPVGDSTSRALDETYIEEKFGLVCKTAELKEVKRQSEQSGILSAASRLRKSQSSGYFNDFDLTENGKDIFNPDFESFLDTWQETPGKKVIIAYKNKTCLDLNLQIRQRLFRDGEIRLQKGDIVILGANNYAMGIFNGEFAVISDVDEMPLVRNVIIKKKVGNITEERTIVLKWRAADLVFPDSENQGKIIKGQILENFLYGDNFLHPDEMRALYIDFKIRHPNLKPRTEEFKEAIVNDPYFQCLKIKYGYAVTCHKAQGGEWENVFTVWDYPTYKNKSFYRWAYTAVTRASKKLFAIDPPYFNSYSNMSVLDAAVAEALKQLTGKEQQINEIEPDDLIMKQMNEFGIKDLPIQIQDHFVSVRQKMREHFIEITGWQIIKYEIFYTFSREGLNAGIKTWINKDLKFNGKYMTVPSLTNNEAFAKETEGFINHLPQVVLKRHTSETILDKVIFDIDVEEQFPFTKNLFDDLCEFLSKSNISVENIDHQNFRERYTLVRGSEKVILDFEYDKKGFFGRVLPLTSQSNSNILLAEITDIIKQLKNRTNAI